jgi:putative membrane protein
MHFDGGWFWGMHVFWWLFWIAAILLFFVLLTPVPRSAARPRREAPLELLQRRYAAGEISTEEYDERKARLEADRTTATDG